MTDVAEIARSLSPLEVDLLTDRCTGWGSWMFSVAGDLAGKSLMKKRDGSYYATERGLAVRDYLKEQG